MPHKKKESLKKVQKIENTLVEEIEAVFLEEIEFQTRKYSILFEFLQPRTLGLWKFRQEEHTNHFLWISPPTTNSFRLRP